MGSVVSFGRHQIPIIRKYTCVKKLFGALYILQLFMSTWGSQNAIPFNSHPVLPGWSAIQHLPVISWWGWWYFCRSVLWTLLPRSRYPEREGWHPTAEHQSHPLLTPHPTNTSSPSEALYWSDGQNKMFTNVSQSYGMQWRTLKSAVNRKIIMLTRAFYMHKNYVISRNNA